MYTTRPLLGQATRSCDSDYWVPPWQPTIPSDLCISVTLKHCTLNSAWWISTKRHGWMKLHDEREEAKVHPRKVKLKPILPWLLSLSHWVFVSRPRQTRLQQKAIEMYIDFVFSSLQIYVYTLHLALNAKLQSWQALSFCAKTFIYSAMEIADTCPYFDSSLRICQYGRRGVVLIVQVHSCSRQHYQIL